jgi:tetratricopeptide (TPR) repeat protein
MLSKQPLPSSSSNLKTEFVQRNSEELDSIELFAELSTGFTLAFLEANSERDRQLVVEYLKNSDQFPRVQWIPIALADEDLQYFGLEVLEKLQAITVKPDRQPVLLISGLERSIGAVGEYPAVLSNLNMERDSYPRTLPYPIVLLLPSYAITRCARYAPDFWSWKSVNIRLHGAIPDQDRQPQDRLTITDTPTVKPVPQSRFDLLQQLLTENPSPTIHRARLLDQLGDAYRSIYENKQAETAYRSALNIYNDLPASLDRANAMDGLAKLYNLQGKFSAALQLWQKALAIQQEIGDRQGEASSLHHLSMIYQALGDYHQALSLSQQSMEIDREIGDRQGEAVSLHVLSIIYQALGDYHQALSLSQQSMEIAKEIGNRQGEEASLHVLSMVYEALGDYPQALSLSQQSMEIAKEIGDRQGEAASLHQLSMIYQALGDYPQALSLSQQSMEIIREIDNRQGEAASLHQLSMIYYLLGDYPQALTYSQQSIEIKREIGDRQGEAASLAQMAVIAYQQGDSALERELHLQAVAIRGTIGDYGGLIITLWHLGVKDEPDALGFLAQSLWLTVHCATNLQNAITIISTIYQKVPAGDNLESLLGATALYFCQTRSHPDQAQLTEISGQIIAHAAQQQGITTQADFEQWFTVNHLHEPEHFLPALLQALAAIVGDGWLFDRSVFQHS